MEPAHPINIVGMDSFLSEDRKVHYKTEFY